MVVEVASSFVSCRRSRLWAPCRRTASPLAPAVLRVSVRARMTKESLRPLACIAVMAPASLTRRRTDTQTHTHVVQATVPTGTV